MSTDLFVGNGNSGDGGDIWLWAGLTNAMAQKGGEVKVTAGVGASTSTSNGGDGGDVTVRGGVAMGGNALLDVGGWVKLLGGTAASASG